MPTPGVMVRSTCVVLVASTLPLTEMTVVVSGGIAMVLVANCGGEVVVVPTGWPGTVVGTGSPTLVTVGSTCSHDSKICRPNSSVPSSPVQCQVQPPGAHGSNGGQRWWSRRVA